MIKIKKSLLKPLLLFIVFFNQFPINLNAFMVLTTEYIAAKKERAELLEKIENLKQNEIENKNLLQQIEQLKRDTKDIKQIEEILGKINNEPETNEIKKVEDKNILLDKELQRLMNEIQKLNKSKNNTDDRLKKNNNELESLRKEVNQLKIEKQSLEKKLSEQENKKETSVNKLVGKLEKMNVSQKYIDKMKQKLTRSPKIEDEYNDMIENLLTKSTRSLPIEYLLEDLTEL